MDVGQTLEKGALGGRSVFARVCYGLGRTSAFLAAVLSFIAKLSGRMASGLDLSSRWLKSKATGVPLVPVGVDVAGEDWEEPTLLPAAPPIPPAAFFTTKPPEQDQEWAAALAAAKLDSEREPEREPSEQEWEAALLAAKNATVAKPSPVKAQTPAPVVAAKAEAPVSDTPRPAPAPGMSELRVGPKAAAPRAATPRITMKQVSVSRETTPKPMVPPGKPEAAAATRKAISAALRS
jgi:hypothetical protein